MFLLDFIAKVAQSYSVITVTGFFCYLVNKMLRRRPFSGIVVDSGIKVSGILVGICICTVWFVHEILKSQISFILGYSNVFPY